MMCHKNGMPIYEKGKIPNDLKKSYDDNASSVIKSMVESGCSAAVYDKEKKVWGACDLALFLPEESPERYGDEVVFI